MTTYDVFFTLLGTIALGGAVLAVTTKHVTHAALWLVVSLTALSGCYLVLGAELVALANLLVYVGAVVVLVLVAMMLTRAPIGRSTDQDATFVRRLVAFVVAVATGSLLGAVLLVSWGRDKMTLHDLPAGRVGAWLFDRWAWPFEMLSLLLLVAAVAAFALLRLRVREDLVSRPGQDDPS